MIYIKLPALGLSCEGRKREEQKKERNHEEEKQERRKKKIEMVTFEKQIMMGTSRVLNKNRKKEG